MNHDDHVRLLRPGIETPEPPDEGMWAELGAGKGAFTLALAELLGPGATIYTVDRDLRALEHGAAAVTRRWPQTTVRLMPVDFTGPLDLPPLAGLLMANSLHYVRDKEPLLRRLVDLLCPGGRFLLVEYNVDRGNHWVPYPLSYSTWAVLARRAGLQDTAQIGRQPSRFLKEFYSAVAYKPRGR